MNDFVIYTDSACDIPPELLKEWGVPYSWLTYVFDGDARQYSNYELPFPEFYDKMRKGSVARTSAVNADAFVQGFEPILQDGKDILYIGFSSGLSSTYHAGCIAAQELREKYPERDIRCVDTLGASGGFGLLLYMAVQKKREGGTIEECEKVVLDNRFHLCHWFTVDDLRLSQARRTHQRRHRVRRQHARLQARAAHGRRRPSHQHVQGPRPQSLSQRDGRQIRRACS